MSRWQDSLLFFGLVLALLVGGFLLAKIRLETFRLGYQIADYKKKQQQLLIQRQKLLTQRARLLSPSTLLEKKQQWQLPLLPPESWMDPEHSQ